ncbi:unnamed protein product [Ceratitis capitata]|uniref:(Mediterranean fruit fly) hypothetical protein n=1 Tax=Ceratitis capitata TaxID=7213 RepID=A0A811UWF2_CERCA|nr:unnamed protein product [Ceratitis capitata]
MSVKLVLTYIYTHIRRMECIGCGGGGLSFNNFCLLSTMRWHININGNENWRANLRHCHKNTEVKHAYTGILVHRKRRRAESANKTFTKKKLPKSIKCLYWAGSEVKTICLL